VLYVTGFTTTCPARVRREVEALPTGEGVFLPCSFWLADNWALVGRHAEARELFERLLVLRNDVGLLSEEYDVKRRRLVGNFPQAFSHVSLINTALNLTPRQDSPARSRLISTRPVRCKTATP
jgi:GH15 family glucan-1,4-alpha-glucosidase